MIIMKIIIVNAEQKTKTKTAMTRREWAQKYELNRWYKHKILSLAAE